MRMISFQKTLPQFQDGSKTVTRRMGWKYLKEGELLMGVEKAMGLKKGEKINKLGIIQVVSTRWEPIGDITQEDVIREGFPDWTPEQFIKFFCDFNKCKRTDLVNRIEFQKLSEMMHLECKYKGYEIGIHYKSHRMDFETCVLNDDKSIDEGGIMSYGKGCLNIEQAFINVLRKFEIENIDIGNFSHRATEPQRGNTAICPDFEPEDPATIPWEALNGK